MNKEQAKQIIQQVLSNTRATVQEHNTFALALETLTKEQEDGTKKEQD